jgi:predicted TPR repeat methyltransferase
MSVSDLYDRVATRYDQLVQSSDYIGPAWLRAQWPALGTPRRALDLGCANGLLGGLLRERYPSLSLVGVDVSPAMVDEARVSGFYDAVHLHDAAGPLHFAADASVDLVVALGFVEFLADPAPLLAEAARVLAVSGTLCVSFQEHWPDRPALAPRTTRSGTVLHHARTRAEVEAALAVAGFVPRLVDAVIGYRSGTGFACPYLMVRAERLG